jgi:hypothetical protein
LFTRAEPGCPTGSRVGSSAQRFRHNLRHSHRASKRVFRSNDPTEPESRTDDSRHSLRDSGAARTAEDQRLMARSLEVMEAMLLTGKQVRTRRGHPLSQPSRQPLFATVLWPGYPNLHCPRCCSPPRAMPGGSITHTNNVVHKSGIRHGASRPPNDRSRRSQHSK